MTTQDDEFTQFGNLDFDADFAGRTTLVTATITTGVGTFTGYGGAKCRKDDHYDARIGFNIAGARALGDLATVLEAEALKETITEERYQLVIQLESLVGRVRRMIDGIRTAA